MRAATERNGSNKVSHTDITSRLQRVTAGGEKASRMPDDGVGNPAEDKQGAQQDYENPGREELDRSAG